MNLCFLLHSLQRPPSCLFVTSLYGEEKWTATTFQLLFSSVLEVGLHRQQSLSLLLKNQWGGTQTTKWTNFWLLCYSDGLHLYCSDLFIQSVFCVIPFSADIQAKRTLLAVYCCCVSLKKMGLSHLPSIRLAVIDCNEKQIRNLTQCDY